MKIRIELSSLASRHRSGVAFYTNLLAQSLAQDPQVTSVHGHYFDFLKRQPKPTLHKNIIAEINRFVPLRVYAKLQSYGFAPAFDIHLPKVDLTILPNFATWPTLRSRLRATVVHDLTYLRYPEVVEEKNLHHLRRVVPRTIKEADFIITVSESVKAELVKEFALEDDRCIVTPIPPDATFFHKHTSAEIHTAKQKYGVMADKYIYFIGNMEPRKNLTTLISAYRLLPATIKAEYGLVLAGGRGWKNADTQRALEEAVDAGENIKHIGFVDQEDSPALYQGASLFVMPSLYEGFGMPILEAMASSCQVVASDIPVLREAGGDAATYANPNDASSFTKAIQDMLTSSNTPSTSDLLQNVSRFSWSRNTRLLRETTEKILQADGIM